MALTDGLVRRFDPDMAPFAAVEVAGAPVDPTPLLDGRALYFTDVLPDLIGDSVTISRDSMYQMEFQGKALAPPAKWPNESELGLSDAPEMLADYRRGVPGLFPT